MRSRTEEKEWEEEREEEEEEEGQEVTRPWSPGEERESRDDDLVITSCLSVCFFRPPPPSPHLHFGAYVGGAALRPPPDL